MKSSGKKRKTTVGDIDAEVLAFTTGADPVLDLDLVEDDCIGSAAHVTMLSRMPVKPPVFSPSECRKVIAELARIIEKAAAGKFRITLRDQDVHLAVERELTKQLGKPGKKIHTARSRNDQVAVDLRLYAKRQLIGAIEEAAALALELFRFAKKHAAVPMVGRTHLQPAMPSSVGLWASAHGEALLDDLASMMHVYELNDQCPLGSAAGYGVPLPIDRQLVSDLLGFSRPCHNVLYAAQARGKTEAVILAALSQGMLTLSRVAQDLVLFTMPEFGYFTMPDAFCTGSSIMPQKNNPDVAELIRAKAARVDACAYAVNGIIRSAAGGYNRDVQETKGPFMEGCATTRASLRIMRSIIAGLKVNRKALRAGFTPGVFATDRALEQVGEGMPFRDAYHDVKANLDRLASADPAAAIARKTHLGGTAGLDFDALTNRAREGSGFARDERKTFHKAISALLGRTYPFGS